MSDQGKTFKLSFMDGSTETVKLGDLTSAWIYGKISAAKKNTFLLNVEDPPDVSDMKSLATAMKLHSKFDTVERLARDWIERGMREKKAEDFEEAGERREWYDLRDSWEKSTGDLKKAVNKFMQETGCSPILGYVREADQGKVFLGFDSSRAYSRSTQAKGYWITMLYNPQWFEELNLRTEELTENDIYKLVPIERMSDEQEKSLFDSFVEDLREAGIDPLSPSSPYPVRYRSTIDRRRTYNENVFRVDDLVKSIIREHALAIRPVPGLLAVVPPRPLAPEALMDEDPRVRTRLKLDLEEAKRQYQQYGEWYENVFEPMVPISQIESKAPWNQFRYEDNKKKIGETGKMPPAFLAFNDVTQKYDISDGIHRINAAKDLGYKYVPAVVSRRRTYPPPKAAPPTVKTYAELEGEFTGKGLVDALALYVSNYYGLRRDYLLEDLNTYLQSLKDKLSIEDIQRFYQVYPNLKESFAAIAGFISWLPPVPQASQAMRDTLEIYFTRKFSDAHLVLGEKGRDPRWYEFDTIIDLSKSAEENMRRLDGLFEMIRAREKRKEELVKPPTVYTLEQMWGAWGPENRKTMLLSAGYPFVDIDITATKEWNNLEDAERRAIEKAWRTLGEKEKPPVTAEKRSLREQPENIRELSEQLEKEAYSLFQQAGMEYEERLKHRGSVTGEIRSAVDTYGDLLKFEAEEKVREHVSKFMKDLIASLRPVTPPAPSAYGVIPTAPALEIVYEKREKPLTEQEMKGLQNEILGMPYDQAVQEYLKAITQGRDVDVEGWRKKFEQASESVRIKRKAVKE